MARCKRSLPCGASSAEPRLFLPGPTEVTSWDYIGGERGFPRATAQPFLRGWYVDLADVPRLRQNFESGLFCLGYGQLPGYYRRMVESLMEVSKRKGYVRAGEEDEAKIPVKTGIPVWFEVAGSRSRKTFDEHYWRDSVWRDYRNVRYEVHPPCEVDGVERMYEDPVVPYREKINQWLFTRQDLYDLSRAFLFNEHQGVPRTYFEGWPMELQDALWAIIWGAAYHPIYPQKDLWPGEQMLRQRPFIQHPKVLYQMSMSYGLIDHTEWGTSEAMVAAHHSVDVRAEHARLWKKQKIVKLQPQVADDDVPLCYGGYGWNPNVTD